MFYTKYYAFKLIVSKANIENIIALIEFKSMIMLLLKTSLFRLFLKPIFVKQSNLLESHGAK